MKILIIKTSSLGDVIHALPAVSDVAKNLPNATLHWVCEESFAEVPGWHPDVSKTIPVALRKWRKNVFEACKSGAIKNFLHTLRKEKYDLVIDAQGLLKSAIITLFSHGKSAGFDFHSVREPLAALFYSKRYEVSVKQHAVWRLRQLFAKACNYPLPGNAPNFGIKPKDEKKPVKSVIFIHGTSRENKLWAEENWIMLAKLVNQQGFKVLLPWGSNEEKARANNIAQNAENAEALPKTTLTELKDIITTTKAAVAVDTGLGHLTAALDIPTISLYGTTNPDLIGTLGTSCKHLVAQKNSNFEPKTVPISLEEVWQNLAPWLTN